MSLGGLVRTIEDKQMKNLTNFYYMLESIDISCDQHNIVIRKCFKKRDDSDEGARMLSAFPTSKIKDWKEKTNYIMAMLLIVDITATTSNTIWITVVKRSCYESRVGIMVVVYIIIIIRFYKIIYCNMILHLFVWQTDIIYLVRRMGLLSIVIRWLLV